MIARCLYCLDTKRANKHQIKMRGGDFVYGRVYSGL
jgi:hypothetical protein